MNCFQISIFVSLRTAISPVQSWQNKLWIAFKLVSLFHYEQPLLPISMLPLVVNCFQISIFVSLRTAWNDVFCNLFTLWIAFKLVSLFHYEQHYQLYNEIHAVVNCFQISIFVSLRTAEETVTKITAQLWIAFKLVSLFHYEQQEVRRNGMELGCELLSN